jgi:hypothetical protein
VAATTLQPTQVEVEAAACITEAPLEMIPCFM